jgi:hypothetical protein
MNVELVAQMFKNYRSNILFHLEGQLLILTKLEVALALTAGCNSSSNQQPARSVLNGAKEGRGFWCSLRVEKGWYAWYDIIMAD